MLNFNINFLIILRVEIFNKLKKKVVNNFKKVNKNLLK